MRKRAAAASIVAAAIPATTDAHHTGHVPGCDSKRCDNKIGAIWKAHHPRARKASAWTANSTSYCLTGTMSDGQTVHTGAVASNRHPLGTRIRLLGQTFMGRSDFTVEDRIGYGSDLDLWAPSCSESLAWGRRPVRYVVVGS